jgi:hypothetical protein
LLYAVISAGLAMISTCGLLAWATDVPPGRPATLAERELVAHLDQRLAVQLDVIKAELAARPARAHGTQLAQR